MNIFLGWILIVLGIITTLFGISGGISKMIKELRSDKHKGSEELESFAEFTRALTEFLKTLISAPLWLALTIIGFVLIVLGGGYIK